MIFEGAVCTVSVRAGTDFAGEKNFVLDYLNLLERDEDLRTATADFRIYLPTGFANNDKSVLSLKRILAANYGWTPVSLYLSRSATLKLPRNFTVNVNDDLLGQIRDLFKDFASR
jgi:hypothetical protein